MKVITIENTRPVAIPMSPSGKPIKQSKPHIFAGPQGPKLARVLAMTMQPRKTTKLTKNKDNPAIIAMSVFTGIEIVVNA
jgi:hypothetical protein